MVLTPDRGLVRLLRGAIIGLIASVLGIGLHAAAGGTSAFGAFFAAMSIASVVGIGLANRQYSFWRAWLVLLGLQPVIHLLATSTAHSSHATATADAGVNQRMLGAHVLAAAVAAAWVVVGDRVLWQWIDSVGRTLTVGACLPDVREPQALIAGACGPFVAATDWMLLSAPRRGPPSRIVVRIPCH